MEKKIMKMGLVAAIVLGAMSGAHAASQASIDFTGKIVKTACDVTLPNTSDSNIGLGAFAGAEFTDMTAVHTAHGAPIILNTGNCAGADLPASGSIKLVASQSNGAIPADVKAAKMWGNSDLGVGIDLKGATYTGSGSLPTTYTTIEPGSGFVIYNNSSTNIETAVDVSKKLPAQVLLKAGLRAYTTPDAIKTGDIKSSIVFTAAYE